MTNRPRYVSEANRRKRAKDICGLAVILCTLICVVAALIAASVVTGPTLIYASWAAVSGASLIGAVYALCLGSIQ